MLFTVTKQTELRSGKWLLLVHGLLAPPPPPSILSYHIAFRRCSFRFFLPGSLLSSLSPCTWHCPLCGTMASGTELKAPSRKAEADV